MMDLTLPDNQESYWTRPDLQEYIQGQIQLNDLIKN